MAIENTAFVSSTFNDVRSFENLRTGSLLRQTAEEAQDLTDQLELSEESLLLAQQENEDLLPPEETVRQVAQEESDIGFSLEDNVTTETPTSDLIAAVNEEASESPESTGALPTDTAVTPPAELETAPTIPEATAIPTPGTETTLADFAAAESEQATAAAAESEQTYVTAEVQTEVEAPSPAVQEAAIGSIETEQATPPPEQEEPVSAPELETQAEDVRRINSYLNSVNGTPRETPANPNEPDIQTNQYQQQVLLQNVTSQLAQTVPPANVVSVLG